VKLLAAALCGWVGIKFYRLSVWFLLKAQQMTPNDQSNEFWLVEWCAMQVLSEKKTSPATSASSSV